MAAELPEGALTRPEQTTPAPVPPLPQVDEANAERASTTYSHYRTGLSHHRTGLSEHRTALSEYRTNLSTHRTNLSTHRTEMSMRRTGMSFQRTRMSADRTLMSIIRTSLSLIGFGFTIYQAFGKLYEAGAIGRAEAPRNFGIALLTLGVLMLVMGIVHHVRFMMGLRRTRTRMSGDELIFGRSPFPISFTLVTAVILLLIALLAVVDMVFKVGPFG